LTLFFFVSYQSALKKYYEFDIFKGQGFCPEDGKEPPHLFKLRTQTMRVFDNFLFFILAFFTYTFIGIYLKDAKVFFEIAMELAGGIFVVCFVSFAVLAKKHPGSGTLISGARRIGKWRFYGLCAITLLSLFSFVYLVFRVIGSSIV
jgi:hypothetical protein